VVKQAEYYMACDRENRRALYATLNEALRRAVKKFEKNVVPTIELLFGVRFFSPAYLRLSSLTSEKRDGLVSEITQGEVLYGVRALFENAKQSLNDQALVALMSYVKLITVSHPTSQSRKTSQT